MRVYSPYQNNQNWTGATFSFMGFMVIGLFVVAVCQSVTKSLLEPEQKEKLITYQTQTQKILKFADKSRTVTDQTLRKWLKQGKAWPLQNSGFYGAEGPKPRLYVVDNTIYQLEFHTYSHDLLLANKDDLASQTKRWLEEQGYTVDNPSLFLASQELDPLKLLGQVTKPGNIWITGSQVREVKTKGIDLGRDIDILIKVTDEVYKEPMQFAMKDIEEKIWEILPNADVFFFSERNPGELLSISAWGKGGVLTDKSEPYPNIVTNMWANAVSLQSLLTRETETFFPSLPGVIAMPTLPEEAREDFFFVEYIKDMLRLGERLSDEDVKFMWEGWKKGRQEESLRDEIREFVRRYERDPFSPEAITESERIQAEAKAAGLSDREFERLWTAEVTRYYEAPNYMPQVTPDQIEFLKGCWRLARAGG